MCYGQYKNLRSHRSEYKLLKTNKWKKTNNKHKFQYSIAITNSHSCSGKKMADLLK